MSKDNFIYELIKAKESLAELREQLNTLQRVIYKAEVDEEESRIRLEYDQDGINRAEVRTKEIREIFGWPICPRVNALRKEEEKKKEEAAKEKRPSPAVCKPVEPKEEPKPEGWASSFAEEAEAKPEKITTVEQAAEKIRQQAKKMPETSVVMKYIKTSTLAMAEIASKLGCSVSDVRQVRDEEIRRLFATGMTRTAISRETGVSRPTVANIVK